MRKKDSLIPHFILVFTAYTFIIYQQLMGGLRKPYANKPLTTFSETKTGFFNWYFLPFLWLVIKKYGSLCCP
ncbi:MAG: hypothetical protein QNJ32_03570 [Xenococcaceae cyanobacterium MO_167.B27]|nr:hypothetical protein [Xenococcaceae cyanobacterium MO_167.B27]